MIDLELATNEELIDELFRRPTFAGSIIYSEETHRYAGQEHKHFTLKSNREPEVTLEILECGLAMLREHIEGR